jgi:hypothetical protein
MLSPYVLLLSAAAILYSSLFPNPPRLRFHALLLATSLALYLDDAFSWEFGPRAALLPLLSSLALLLAALPSLERSLASRLPVFSGPRSLSSRLLPLLLASLLLSAPAPAPSSYPPPPPAAYDFEAALAKGAACTNGATPPGLYGTSSPSASLLTALWLRSSTPLDPPPPAPAFTGDLRTLLPFLLASVPPPPGGWHRRWLPVSDGEHVAVDCAFPEEGFDGGEPVHLLLHGLNGGSDEE